MPKPVKLRDFGPEASNILSEVLTGLRKPAKELPSKLFYDERGSQLFEEITRLDEYYPTRSETAIMKSRIGEIVDAIGSRGVLVEYGSGNSEKTEILLDHLPNLLAYVPIDISRDHLMSSARKIAERYPRLEVLPVFADYVESSFRIPVRGEPEAHRVVYFPGSTIGNFHIPEAVAFLQRIAKVCGDGGALLIGVDLKKDPVVLHRAYNDSKGVTAQFNANILQRINDELGSDFRLDRFRHRAIYNRELGRIEMHLVSLEDQTVHVGDAEIEFKTGESIWTESSYKYSTDEFASLADQAGFDVDRVWMDEDRLFSVQYLTTKT